MPGNRRFRDRHALGMSLQEKRGDPTRKRLAKAVGPPFVTPRRSAALTSSPAQRGEQDPPAGRANAEPASAPKRKRYAPPARTRACVGGACYPRQGRG